MNQKIDWRNRSNVGINKRLMGFYESPEEILAGSSDYNATPAGRLNRIIAGFCCGSVYLYPVLI